MVFAQTPRDTIVAKSGDGIFSILRSAGIHPIKYYVEFLNLNEKNVRNGSDLIIGTTYILPNAPDSFRNMGTRISVDTGLEESIFDKELSKMKIKDATLLHTVYYIMNTPETILNSNSNDFMLGLAKELLEKGARVCLLENALMQPKGNSEKDIEAFKISVLGNYSGVVNRKFLVYNGNYQRVLLIEDGIDNTKNIEVTVNHYGQSKEGTRLAASLQDVFRKNAIRKSSSKEGISSFNDEANIFLAKNVLPPITIIGLNSSNNNQAQGIQLKSARPNITKMIANGILKDYSSLNFEDN
ncbi:hypothetical protein ACOCEA_16855 [Maribacter sp. CXY002]|uniref:hypothetical protein n=1 Tax=Maribacter luteocoastalis TaxID=3407671 RepID=UPI003B68074C